MVPNLTNDGAAAPVLVTMFNRPAHAARVIESLAASKPRRVFLAVDGPREGHQEDVERVALCRNLVSRIDWECEVKTRFRQENFGCRRGMIDAVSWFFEEVGSGIVLEDDCLPHPAAVSFFSDGLKRYEREDRVFQVSGFAHLERFWSRAYFLPLSSSWGWATWRDRWREFLDEHEASAERILGDAGLQSAFDLGGSFPYAKMLRRSVLGEVSSWAVFFQAQLHIRDGLVLYPPKRLISNIGFDNSGTHCSSRAVAETGEFSVGPVRWRMPRRIEESHRLFAKVKSRIKPKRNSAEMARRRPGKPKAANQ